MAFNKPVDTQTKECKISGSNIDAKIQSTQIAAEQITSTTNKIEVISRKEDSDNSSPEKVQWTDSEGHLSQKESDSEDR